MLDSIEVNGQRFGGTGGHANEIILAKDERVSSISYDSQKNNPNQHCNFKITTNIRSYGPYVTGPPVCDTGATNMVTRKIADCENGFFDFLKNESGTVPDGQITFSLNQSDDYDYEYDYYDK